MDGFAGEHKKNSIIITEKKEKVAPIGFEPMSRGISAAIAGKIRFVRASYP
jgi:hypothetical protein